MTCLAPAETEQVVGTLQVRQMQATVARLIGLDGKLRNRVNFIAELSKFVELCFGLALGKSEANFSLINNFPYKFG